MEARLVELLEEAQSEAAGGEAEEEGPWAWVRDISTHALSYTCTQATRTPDGVADHLEQANI